MIVAINYSDENFRKSQKMNTKTAYKKGKVDKVIEYSPKDIDNKFYKENEKILSQKRGGGYWLWKPYIISETMKDLKDGDYLFYCDSGAIYVNNVKYLINDLENSGQDIMIFELPLLEKQWTKMETFKKMECENEIFFNTNQRLATYILFKVSNKSKKFINQYFEYCKNEEIITDYFNKDIKQCESFIAHRHDQSILSLLSKKHKIEPFRDPSQYGNRPWEYRGNKRIYKLNKYKNSEYPQIVLSNRKANARIFLLKENIKKISYKLGIMNEERFLKKNNIKK